MSRTRIKWSSIEERTLAEKMHARWAQSPEEDRRWHMRIYEWVMANDWPEDRRRKIAGLTVIPNVRKIFLGLTGAAELVPVPSQPTLRLEEKGCPQPPHVEPMDQEISLAELREQLRGLVIEKPVEYDPTKFLRAQPSEVLIQEFFARLAQERAEMRMEIMTALQRIEDAVTNRNRTQHYMPTIQRPVALPVPAAAPRPPKTKIAVLGLLPDQFQHIENAFASKADVLELLFVKNEGSTGAANFRASAHYAVINTKFISHSQRHEIEEAVGRDQCHWVDGGISSVKQKIYDILSRQRH